MFGKGIKLFKLLGFEVRLDWSWIIIAALVTWSLAQGVFPYYFKGLSVATYWWMGAAGAAGLFACIVLHELGHSLIARRFGIPMRGITLFVFGGVAEMGEEPPTPQSEFFMAIAGPITSVILAGVFYGFSQLGETAVWPATALGVLWYLVWINLALAAFNMVPAFPLDGGRVLRSILWGAKGNFRWATRVASAIGTGFGFALILLGLVNFVFGDFVGGIWWVVLGLFLRWASRASYQQALLLRALQGESVQHFMSGAPVTVPPTASVKDMVEHYVYRYHYKMLPVVNEGRLLGCVTVTQIKHISKEDWERRTALDLITPSTPENSIAPDEDAMKALSRMNRTHLSRLMVVDHGRLVGVIALKDMLKFLSLRIELEGA